MIFKIDSNYANSIQGSALSDLCCKMMKHGHFIDCDGNTFTLIEKSILGNASKTQKDCFMNFKGFGVSGCLTKELRTYLTTIIVDGNTYSLDDLDRMVTKESRVVVENGPYEWPVYKAIIGTFERDRKYGNLFRLLVNARNRKYLTDLHCGGVGMIVPMVEQQEQGDYENVFSLKSCIVFDRDTADNTYFDKNKNALFAKFCDKKNDAVTGQDIYTLNQFPYHWHMWYKREIENYFTDDCYIDEGVNVTGFPSDLNLRDYYLIDKSSAHGYEKSLLSSIAEKMSRSDYDTMASKAFSVDGELMTEMQLFLLKLVKII